jgi:tetratricopeptide (TPR) repeat protein
MPAWYVRSVPDTDLVGRTLAGRYDLLALLGTGGMGSVYRARDRELDEQIALKVIRSDIANQPRALERFRHEVKLARRVTHRNVARTFELGHGDGITFCTMELVDGESLRHRMAHAWNLPAAEAVAIARDLCDALVAAHAAGVIHRDIKPDNVLIASDGRVVLADFGVAAASIGDLGEVSGTPAYMAPEQAHGEPATPAADVYSVGVLLYEMVSGTRAFHGDTVRGKGLPAHLELAHGPPELAHVIARATARDRSERVATASELRRLLAMLDQAAPSAPPAGDVTELDPRTVIVLPPRATAEVSHLVQAIHEEVLGRLGRIPRVRALSRVSPTAEPADSVVELVAGEVVTATITRPAGASMSIALPIAVREIEAVADAIVAAVVNALQQRPAQLAPEAAAAIEQTLVARAYIQRGFGDLADTLATLQRANAVLPGDPRIAALLAICEVRSVFFYADAPPERLARARELVRAALETAPDRAESHVAAGHLLLHVGNPVRAARHFREAIARAPHVAEAHEHLGRMLVEAGFLEVGCARLDDALAIAPHVGGGRWDVARAYALEGRWDDSDRLVAELVAEGADRWVARARLAWWRGDLDRMARVKAERTGPLRGDLPQTIATLLDAMLGGTWQAHREEILANAMRPSASHRRRAFDLQLAAEAAGFFGEAELCADLITRFVATGAYDRPWIDRCPVLEIARGLPVVVDGRAHVQRRADAILDAMYGDVDDTEMPETAVL